jgi:hypothetical protein
LIPPIEQIVDDLLAGRIAKQQAIVWLMVHAEDAGKDIEDDFAIAAMKSLITLHHVELSHEEIAVEAYKYAYAAAKVRAEKG